MREEFPYRRKPWKDYRLEAEWEKNAIKVLTLRTSELSYGALTIPCSGLSVNE